MVRINKEKIEERFEESQNSLVLQSSDFSLQGLREMVESNIIDLTPKYQRRERWGVDRQSELIESFLLNIPVPPIYLAEEEYGIYSIIDGKQRITATADFLSNSFKLRKLESFPELNGLKFRELPPPLQNALRIRPYFRVITLLKQSKPELKYEVFLRLNRGGIRLNNQEIRNVAFRGHLNDAIYECAENDFLRSALNISGSKSAAYQQMQDAELVLRFLMLKEKWQNFSGSFSRSMDKFMIEKAHIDQDKSIQLASSFDEAITRVADLWGEHAFERWDGKKWRKQALAGLYDAQMIAAHELSDTHFQALKGKQKEILDRTKMLFTNDSFEEAVRLGTNTPSRMKYRVEMIKSELLNLAGLQ